MTEAWSLLPRKSRFQDGGQTSQTSLNYQLACWPRVRLKANFAELCPTYS